MTKYLFANESSIERYTNELTQTIIVDAITEAYSRSHDVTFYRYYHVFRDGELRALIDRCDTLRVIDSFYDHTNWCIIAEKI